MDNNLQIFPNEQFGDLRTIEENGKVLFCGKDVAEALGYARPRDAISDHTKGAVKRRILTNGGEQEMSFITEGDVYRLIVSSKLPKAQEFEVWVFDKVLPQIRKNGAYMTKETLKNCLSDPDFAIGLLSKLKEDEEKINALEAENKVQAQQIAEFQPKASYYDVILNCTDLMSVSKIAKDYGKSAVWLNAKLHELGVQYKQGDIWLLYQKYAEMGYTSTKTHVVNGTDGMPHSKVNTAWTQRGRLFIYDLLKSHGILPLIESNATA